MADADTPVASLPKDVAEVGRLVKKKYPQYGPIEDARLGEMVVKKYPQYARGFAPQRGPAAPGFVAAPSESTNQRPRGIRREESGAFTPMSSATGLLSRPGPKPVTYPGAAAGPPEKPLEPVTSPIEMASLMVGPGGLGVGVAERLVPRLVAPGVGKSLSSLEPLAVDLGRRALSGGIGFAGFTAGENVVRGEKNPLAHTPESFVMGAVAGPTMEALGAGGAKVVKAGAKVVQKVMAKSAPAEVGQALEALSKPGIAEDLVDHFAGGKPLTPAAAEARKAALSQLKGVLKSGELRDLARYSKSADQLRTRLRGMVVGRMPEALKPAAGPALEAEGAARGGEPAASEPGGESAGPENILDVAARHRAEVGFAARLTRLAKEKGIDPEDLRRVLTDEKPNMADIAALHQRYGVTARDINALREGVPTRADVGPPTPVHDPVFKSLRGLDPELAAKVEAGNVTRAEVEVAQHGIEAASIPHEAIGRVKEALKRVPDLRTLQERLYSVERGRRIARYQAAGKGLPGEAAARAKHATLGGPLPEVEFGSLRKLVDQNDIDAIFKAVNESPFLTKWDRPEAAGALFNLFGAEGAKLPTRSELEVLERVFDSDFITAVLNKRSTLSTLARYGVEVIGAPRAVMASFDFSAPLRQGLFLGAGYPRQFAAAFVAMLKRLGTEEGTRELELNIAQRANYGRMRAANLAITKAGSVLANQEERFMGGLGFVRKIPGIGYTERAYTGFLNKLRADVFDQLILDGQRAGLNIDDPKFLKELGSFINAASGRGDLPRFLENHGRILNALFFSPRLFFSRLQILNPMTYVHSNAIVRKAALRSMMGLGSFTVTLLAIAKAGGAQVGGDINSPDWAKIKVGNTRSDILGGLQQFVRVGANIVSGSIKGGQQRGFSGAVVGGFRPIPRFFRNKLAPIPAMISNIAVGTDYEGRPTSIPREVAGMFTPMVLRDMYEAEVEWGWWRGTLMAAPGIFGVGVQTYKPHVRKDSASSGKGLKL